VTEQQLSCFKNNFRLPARTSRPSDQKEVFGYSGITSPGPYQQGNRREIGHYDQ